MADGDVEDVFEESVLPVGRGRGDRSRLLVFVVVASKPASESLDADLLEVGRRHLSEAATAQPFDPGLPIALVIPEGALADLGRGQVLADHVGEEMVDLPSLVPRTRPLESLALDFLGGDALGSCQRSVKMAVRTGPADPPVAPLSTPVFLQELLGSARVCTPDHATAARGRELHTLRLLPRRGASSGRNPRGTIRSVIGVRRSALLRIGH